MNSFLDKNYILITAVFFMLIPSFGTAVSEEEPVYIESDEEYLVSSIEELNWVRNDVTADYRLTDDIDASGSNLESIGSEDYPYNGEFDGNGYSVTGLQNPLFGVIAANGEVRHLNLENVDITGSGSIAKDNKGTISNVSVEGSIEADRSAGGLVAENEGLIAYSESNISLNSEGSGVGGIAGQNWAGTIFRSQSHGTIQGNEEVGGIAGSSQNKIIESYSTASVQGNGKIGGVLGLSEHSELEDVYSNASVSGNTAVGGIIGYVEDSNYLNRSYFSGEIDGDRYTGGLVGWNKVGVHNSFWSPELSGFTGDSDSDGVSPEAMRDIQTYSDAGWFIQSVDEGEVDKTSVWNIREGELPFLHLEELESRQDSGAEDNVTRQSLLDRNVESFDDLTHFPRPFIEEDNGLGHVVIGEDALAADTISALDIAPILTEPPATGVDSSTYEQRTPKDPADVGQLDTEIDAQNYEGDMILIGGPVVNDMTKKMIQEASATPREDYEEGKAFIEFIDNSINDIRNVVIVAGENAEDTRAAAEFAKNYKTNSPKFENKTRITIWSENKTVIQNMTY